MSQQRIYRQVLQRIKQAEQQSQEPIKQLQLDSIQIRQITKELKNLIQSYPSISYLTLNDCQLTSLNNFPKLPNLTILQLSNNNIQDDELFNILKNSGISHLMIDQNKLKSIQKVSILRQLPNLQQLQLANNLIGQSDFYRQQIFQRIPQIKIIDCKDRYGNIAIDSQSQSQQNQNSMIQIKSYSKPSPLSDKIQLKQKNNNLNNNSTNQSLLSFINHQSQSNQSSNQSQQNISQQSQEQNNYNKIQQEQHSTKTQSKSNHQSTQKHPKKIIKLNQIHHQYKNENEN